LAIGVVTAVGCHFFNFMLMAADDAGIGLLDLFLKPLRLWTRTCQQLPKRLWFFNALVCGLTAAAMSPLVIGGIPYERFWDWGFKEPPKQNLMGAVVDRMKQLESKNGSDNLEDAIQRKLAFERLLGREHDAQRRAFPRHQRRGQNG
jgi:hypothetical protein